MNIQIKNGRLIDPKNNIDAVQDLLLPVRYWHPVKLQPGLWQSR
jgi:hypothetical protein